MNYNKVKNSSTYNVSKEIKQVVYAPGSINRMTIAVAINKILTEEESKELHDLVMSASGANEERGDVVKITSMQFTSFDEATAEAEKENKNYEMQTNIGFWINKIGPLAIVLILGLVALFMIKGVLKKPYEGRVVSDGYEAPQQLEDFASQEAELEKLAQESQKLIESSNLPMLEAKLAPELEMMKSQLNNMIVSNPADASRLLLSFIKD